MKGEKNISHEKEILDRLEEVRKTQGNLINRLEGVENVLKGILSQLKPEEDRVINLIEILRYPEEYGFKFSEKKSLYGIIREKEKQKDIRKNLGFAPFDYNDLREDRYLPDNEMSEKLLKILGIPRSDFILAKANTYRKIKESPEELISPYLDLGILELLEKLKELKFSGEIFGFVMNLFVRNIGTELLSGDTQYYERKTREEIERILKLRESICLFEYPTTDNYEKGLNFRVPPETIAFSFWNYGAKIFAKLKIEETPRFYKIGYDWFENIDDKIAVLDIIRREVSFFEKNEFFKIWEKTGFEFVALNEHYYSFDSTLKAIADEIHSFESGDPWLLIKGGSASYWNYAEKSLIYTLFKNKWIDELEYPKGKKTKSLTYVIEPDLY